MTQEAGADSGNPDKSGSGAPEGGSPGGGSENELDEKFEKRIKSALANQARQYETRIEAVRAEFDAFKAGAGQKQAPADRPKVYTKAELKAGVDGGQITQEQADDIWDTQRETQIAARVETVALETVTRQATKERIDTDLAAYKRLKPEIMEQGSETREKIREEFTYLASIGKPRDAATELAAIRAVLGPLAKLDKSASAARSQESHEETGGGGSGGRPKGNSSKKLVDHLAGDAKKFYERAIEQGRYPKGWDDVEAELKFASPKTRQRLGLPA